MERNSKTIDYFYKACDLQAANENEKRMFELFNEYGYNMDSNKRRAFDDSQRYQKHKRVENHQGLNIKR